MDAVFLSGRAEFSEQSTARDKANVYTLTQIVHLLHVCV